MIRKEDKLLFTKRLLDWNLKFNKRHMPWKGEKDPYKIWLSEIILQQTRVEQGWDYYNRFIKSFPSIEKLAQAPEQKIFKLWEGLGYYTRCKNLIATAKFIAQQRAGKFPETYHDILALKGVGPYTAAAIGSFAFNLPYAVIDGNVFRVLARFFGIDSPTDSTAGKLLFTNLAQELLDKKQPGIYNQAIMDFGAIICKPKNPLCAECPLKAGCMALKLGKVNSLPVKLGKIIKKSRWFYYLVVEQNGKAYVRKRGAKDIWENLYEFILIEADKSLNLEQIKQDPLFKNFKTKNIVEIIKDPKIHRQQLTHQTIQGQFIRIKIKDPIVLKDYKPVTYKGLAKLPFPKFITAWLTENAPGHLKDKNVSLNLL